jgi:hypothetical protein
MRVSVLWALKSTGRSFINLSCSQVDNEGKLCSLVNRDIKRLLVSGTSLIHKIIQKINNQELRKTAGLSKHLLTHHSSTNMRLFTYLLISF